MSRTSRSRPRRTAGGIDQLPWCDLINPHAPVEVLTADHVEAIHHASLRLLAGTGMRVLCDRARSILAAAGCLTDDTMVRFDPDLVEATIATAPQQFMLRARNSAHDLVIGGRHVVFGSVGGPAFCHDLDRGRRPGTAAEQADFIRVV